MILNESGIIFDVFIVSDKKVKFAEYNTVKDYIPVSGNDLNNFARSLNCHIFIKYCILLFKMSNINFTVFSPIEVFVKLNSEKV